MAGHIYRAVVCMLHRDWHGKRPMQGQVKDQSLTPNTGTGQRLKPNAGMGLCHKIADQLNCCSYAKAQMQARASTSQLEAYTMQAVTGCLCVHVGWQLGCAAAGPFPEGGFPIDSPAAHLQEGATGRC